jgi:anti-sigma factor RsiW
MTTDDGRDPTAEVSDEMLMAYVDGELGADEAAMIERAIAGDAGLRRRAADFRDTRLLARGAFADERAAPVPAALVAAVRAAAERAKAGAVAPAPTPAAASVSTTPLPAAAAAAPNVVAFPVRRRTAYAALPIAACLMLAAGLAGFLLGETRAPGGDVAAAGLLGADPAVVAGLAGLVGGETRTLADGRRLEAVASFPVEGGVCRVFTLQPAGTGAVEAVACDRGSGLAVEVAVAASGTDGAYTPASDIATGVVDAFLDAAGAGDALTVEEERALPQR